MSESNLFPGFTTQRIQTSGAEIRCVVGGTGPPVLLLHGYPQTHAIWHKIAPSLAHRFSVVCADLRGYGDSSKPPSDPQHTPYSKRAMAQDMVELMRNYGHARFLLVGHDRGGRVAHRLCLDHPDAVVRVAMLDISPTRIMYAKSDQAFATAYYHWYFLIQPFDLPEKLIGGDPIYYLHRKLGSWGTGTAHFDPRAMVEYERCFRDPATIHATCEDYRAAASIDLEHDAEDSDRRVTCPLLVLWGEKGVVNRFFDPIADWKRVATDVRGKTLPCGHYLPEEQPQATLYELETFFSDDG